ncbi:MAG: glycosyltransferase [Candidatus Levybacteria bacterium]|nr:glycosyltransferase [Candidatus Levybacteria bacterium]
MKVALVHDYIKEYGGAERVLEALHQLYPDAPVFTTVYLPEFLGPHKERFEDWDIRTSILQRLPYKQKLISLFRIISPLVFKLFDFSNYDLIIVSATGAYFPNTISKRKAKSEKRKSETQNSKVEQLPLQICYCHTPPRYLYGYATARDWQKNIITKIIGIVGNHILRMVDYNASKNVDYYIANSEEVAGRIKKFYRREAVVIYPPVDITKDTRILRYKDIKNRKEKSPSILVSQYPNIQGYFLAGGRLARPKHIDLIIDVCLKLNVPLKVFGKGFAGYEKELQDIKILRYKDIKNRKEKSPNILVSQYPNIQFLGEVSDEEKWELMRNAKAYINASEDEDFGILPVEAMAAGTPVIAYRSGGVKETVVEGKTGIFFDELTVSSLSKAIQSFDKLRINKEDCIKQAEKFSKERFQAEIKDFINKKVKT